MSETTVGKFSPQIGGTFAVADKIKFQLIDTLVGHDQDLSAARTMDTPDQAAVPPDRVRRVYTVQRREAFDRG